MDSIRLEEETRNRKRRRHKLKRKIKNFALYFLFFCLLNALIYFIITR